MCSRSAFLHCRLPLPLLSSWASTVSCRVSRLLCLSTGFRRGVGIGRGVCTYSPTPSSAPGKVPVFPAGTGGRRGAHVPSESYDKEGGQVERMSRGFGGGAGIMPPESFQEAASGQVHRVVTSFLLHPTDQVPPGSGNRRVLVARRSNQVSTFKGVWAGISGRVEEESPLAAAWREIQEETSLAPSSLRLIRAGKPMVIVPQATKLSDQSSPPAAQTVQASAAFSYLDASPSSTRAAPNDTSHTQQEDQGQQRHFHVYPFLFQVLDLSQFKLDWEHTAYAWVNPWGLMAGQLALRPVQTNPNSLAKISTPTSTATSSAAPSTASPSTCPAAVPLVPQLGCALSRVYMDAELQELLDALVEDRQSGAAQLSAFALTALEQWLGQLPEIEASSPPLLHAVNALVSQACPSSSASPTLDQSASPCVSSRTACPDASPCTPLHSSTASAAELYGEENPGRFPSFWALPPRVLVRHVLDVLSLLAQCRPSMVSLHNAMQSLRSTMMTPACVAMVELHEAKEKLLLRRHGQPEEEAEEKQKKDGHDSMQPPPLSLVSGHSWKQGAASGWDGGKGDGNDCDRPKCKREETTKATPAASTFSPVAPTRLVHSSIAALQQQFVVEVAAVLSQACSRLLQRQEESTNRMIHHCANLVNSPELYVGFDERKPTRVLVHSYSSSILKALLLAIENRHKQAAIGICPVDLEIFICESRPLCEGTRFASDLLSACVSPPTGSPRVPTLRCTLLTDAQIGVALQAVDAVLLGGCERNSHCLLFFQSPDYSWPSIINGLPLSFLPLSSLLSDRLLVRDFASLRFPNGSL
eukprot:GHVT01097189.1.p1 GENE.GHVT01097189.1~~GHVT01097189.1.p1  ORF type:complete len:813 (-),score=122.22 GHVT01097189.1:1152-3590(-)